MEKLSGFESPLKRIFTHQSLFTSLLLKSCMKPFVADKVEATDVTRTQESDDV